MDSCITAELSKDNTSPIPHLHKHNSSTYNAVSTLQIPIKNSGAGTSIGVQNTVLKIGPVVLKWRLDFKHGKASTQYTVTRNALDLSTKHM